MRYLIALILSFIFSTSTFSALISAKDTNSAEQKRISEILTNVFYEEIFKRTKGLKPEIEVKKAKISINEGRRGKMIIEMMKQRNRERLALKSGFDPSKVKSGSDLVKMKKEDNKILLKKMLDEEKKLEAKYAHLPANQRSVMIWQEQARNEMIVLRKKVQEEHKAWRKKHLKTLKIWDGKKVDYRGEVDNYKSNLINIPLILPVSKKDIKKDVEVKIVRDFNIVSSSLDVEIRDQKRRPTCSSFSGIRAMEVLLAQNNKQSDLSEQYFYWASKPDCQNKNCSKMGSWVGYGLKHSKESKRMDIPTETSCPYKPTSIVNNETQNPLKNSCATGKVKVNNFEYLKTLDHVINALKNNIAVMASIKLSPNFYDNKGLVLQKESKKKGSMDSHSKGHAVLLVGYMKLPKILNEGSVCFITANSWGLGWGHGGYSCLSEKWMIEHRNRNPFVTVNALEI
jgi:C1A family cysteine protease